MFRYRIRVRAANRPKMAIRPETAATVCKIVSVRTTLSSTSIGMPTAAAPALATVTIDAQIVRDVYQGFIISI
jgi:hypothetical protein